MSYQNENIVKAAETGKMKEKDFPESFVPKNMKKRRMIAWAVCIIVLGSVYYFFR